MSEKKYTSGKAVDAEIQRLLDLKKKMVTDKTKVFMDAVVKNGLAEKLSDLSDADVKEYAFVINTNFDKLMATVQEHKRVKQEKTKSAKSKKAEMNNQVQTVQAVQPEVNNQVQTVQAVQPEMNNQTQMIHPEMMNVTQ